MTPGFSGKYKRELAGKHRHWLLWDVPLWEYSCDRLHPLSYTTADGLRLTPDRHIRMLSDGMSSPPFLWGIDGLAQTDFPRSVYFHDSATRYGGLYVNGIFQKMTRGCVNSLLYDMVRAEGGSTLQASRIYAGVSIGMLFIWDERKQAGNRKTDGVYCA